MNRLKKTLYVIVIIVLLVQLTDFGNAFDNFEGGRLELHFIDVGQGDSILVKSNKETMLIDGGKGSSKDVVLDYLKKEKIKNIKYLVASHPHEDHIGGLGYVIENIPVETVIMPRVTSNTQVFERLLDTIEDKGLKIKIPKVGDSYELDGSSLKILGPSGESYSNLNDYSISIKLVFGNNSFLFTGDAEALAERELIENHGNSLRADLLKLGHHGSNTSSTEEFLDQVMPSYGIISAGPNNSYGHPDKEILDRLKERSIEIYRTDLMGHIIVSSDGEIIKLKHLGK